MKDQDQKTNPGTPPAPPALADAAPPPAPPLAGTDPEATPSHGPRIVTADIEQAIGLAQYIHYYRVPHTTTTICAVTLANGFTVVGKSAAVSKVNFSTETGQKVALEHVREQLWELLGFRLKQALYDGPVAHRP